MTPEEQNGAKPDRWRKMGQAAAIAGVLVTVLGIVVSTWLNLRVQTKKTASIAVVSSQPFILSVPNSSGQFQIFYRESTLGSNSQGTEITNPWLSSLRLVNTGNIVIEQQDIVDPLQIEIEDAEIVQVRVSDESFGAKPGNPIVSANKIILEPFFLNPGGFLEYNLITDGKPSIKPARTVIREMVDPIALEFNQQATPVFITAVPLSGGREMMLLVFATLLVLATTFVGILGLSIESRSLIRKLARSESKELENKINSIELSSFQIFVQVRGEPGFSGSLPAPIVDEKELLKIRVAESSQLELNTGLEALIKRVDAEYREKFRDRLAELISIRLPSPIRARMQWRISEMDMRSLSLQEFLDKVKQATQHEIHNMPRMRLSDLAEITIAVFLVTLGTAAGLVVGGTWRNLLGV